MEANEATGVVEEEVPEDTEPNVQIGKEVIRKLKVEIDDDTLAAYGNELADLIQSLEGLEDDKKASANEYKCKIDSASARARELANLIRARCQYLDVTCREERDFEAREFILRRLDTDEVVERRPLREDECQAELPIEEQLAEQAGELLDEVAKGKDADDAEYEAQTP